MQGTHGSRMTKRGKVLAKRRVKLRAICDSLNDERGTGGQSRLTRLLGWHHSTVWRKLNGKSPITESDALAIQKAVETAQNAGALPTGEQERVSLSTEVLK